ncbi:hypothetical protein QYE76_019675 [Lolium multiflorum]|uniref:Uncharacterized protein n=1 Tax=Lolium multiflorum TaxID=4521 RepID=A0AAD8R7D7_LOLMU|nr:hypothetical protein QYE76_019675 [Lolium multiflorum]
MEVKMRAAAIAVLCMFLMLSGQQQAVAAMSKYCECYHGCYTGCRQHMPPWACMVLCVVDCRPNQPGDGDGYSSSSVTSCRKACSLFSSRFSICGSSAALPDSTDAASCVQNCNEKLSLN